MAVGIGRSIKEGFRTANRSWAGIGFLAGAWILLFAILGLGVWATNPPPELFQEPEETALLEEEPAAIGEEAADDAAGDEAAGEAEEGGELDALGPVTPADEERGRIIGEWARSVWPVLVLIVALFVLGNTWLTGGQIGYLGKRVTTQQASVSEFWRSGTQAFGRLLLASLLGMTAVAAVVLVIVLIGALFGALSNVMPDVVLGILGVLLGAAFLAGLVWMGVKLAFWFITIVTERAGPVAGIKASFRATRGHWWRVLGLGVLLGLIGYGAALAFALLDGLGNVIGGPLALVTTVISNVGGIVANLYLGFVALAAYLRLYQDVKGAGAGPTAPSVV